MNPFFEYLIKSTISLSLLFLLFKAFMQNDKNLLLNRFLLLGILVVSAVIPLFNFQFFQTEVPVKQVEVILAVCEVFMLLHFFNPLMWLLRRDIKLIHEYQADQAVLNKGIDAQQYQLLVLQKAVGERRFALANSFTQKPILKRIKMMKKNKNETLERI